MRKESSEHTPSELKMKILRPGKCENDNNNNNNNNDPVLYHIFPGKSVRILDTQ